MGAGFGELARASGPVSFYNQAVPHSASIMGWESEALPGTYFGVLPKQEVCLDGGWPIK